MSTDERQRRLAAWEKYAAAHATAHDVPLGAEPDHDAIAAAERELFRVFGKPIVLP